ncbi:hypothetical protein ASG35_21980 [Burkholderia sp. Leaf177]|nr:hypothetical protein ASG35_21980 [Burkholderia sp. Leaf177]
MQKSRDERGLSGRQRSANRKAARGQGIIYGIQRRGSRQPVTRKNWNKNSMVKKYEILVALASALFYP